MGKSTINGSFSIAMLVYQSLGMYLMSFDHLLPGVSSPWANLHYQSWKTRSSVCESNSPWWSLNGYESIPINTIFRGMNIHLPAIFMFTRGTRFWPLPNQIKWDGFRKSRLKLLELLELLKYDQWDRLNRFKSPKTAGTLGIDWISFLKIWYPQATWLIIIFPIWWPWRGNQGPEKIIHPSCIILFCAGYNYPLVNSQFAN